MCGAVPPDARRSQRRTTGRWAGSRMLTQSSDLCHRRNAMPRYTLTHRDARRQAAASYVCDVRELRNDVERRLLEVEINGTTHEVDVLSDANPLLVLINHEPVELLFHEGRYVVLGRKTTFEEGAANVSPRHANTLGGGTLLAPMPGKVVRVLCHVGNTVEIGQPLVVLEAMKMENELCAPRPGRVTAVHVTEGQAVESRAKLLEVG